jgi:hypothetical protein
LVCPAGQEREKGVVWNGRNGSRLGLTQSLFLTQGLRLRRVKT